MKMLTFMELSEIAEYEKLQGAELNAAKERLAWEVTSLIHGKEAADEALAAAKAVFAAGGMAENMPTTVLSPADFTEGKILVSDMLVKAGLAPSKAEAKRLIAGGGIMIGDEKAEGFAASVDMTDIPEDGLIVKKGKKTFHRFRLA